MERDQITFYSLDDHGSNDGAPTDTVVDEYWNKNHPLENQKAILLEAVVCLITVPM